MNGAPEENGPCEGPHALDNTAISAEVAGPGRRKRRRRARSPDKDWIRGLGRHCVNTTIWIGSLSRRKSAPGPGELYLPVCKLPQRVNRSKERRLFWQSLRENLGDEVTAMPTDQTPREILPATCLLDPVREIGSTGPPCQNLSPEFGARERGPSARKLRENLTGDE
ncbi:uncharacterized protein LOC144475834 [Augochlora pura]